MKLFDKIRILRKARGLSQEQLGYSLSRVNKDGISRQTVSDWENGKFEPKLENIRDLAEVFDVSFDALLDESVDLENESVLEAVLNKKPYENKEEKEVATPEIKTSRITFRELALLLISAYFVLGAANNIYSVIYKLIVCSDVGTIITSVVITAIELALLAPIVVAFALFIKGIFKGKKSIAGMILLIAGISCVFAFFLYNQTTSLVLIASRSGERNEYSSYIVNGYSSSYERLFASSIVNAIFYFILYGGLLACSILIFRSYRKPKALNKQQIAK